MAEGLRAGDRAALEEAYRQHAEVIYRMALRLLGNEHDARDVLQDTFVTAWEKAHTFRGESGLRTWLVRIGLNACYRLLRRGARSAPIEAAESVPAAGPGADPAWAAERARLRLSLERAMEGLPVEWRTVLVLRDAMGFSYEEMSEALGCPLGTVRSRLFRARSALRERLGAQGEEWSRP